ncbi:hypothetical protein OH76DRAFT_890423 [Lentinus brumalis]|uniref:Uncharacterized protein n=1 Tax=Lentinus brumalis TaxID=2498619 RepID=A0A371D118_9APHY|nr:hypothetical protein OH76DRAFT_890423 [Polyporus brumalis]
MDTLDGHRGVQLAGKTRWSQVLARRAEGVGRHNRDGETRERRCEDAKSRSEEALVPRHRQRDSRHICARAGLVRQVSGHVYTDSGALELSGIPQSLLLALSHPRCCCSYPALGSASLFDASHKNSTHVLHTVPSSSSSTLPKFRCIPLMRTIEGRLLILAACRRT